MVANFNSVTVWFVDALRNSLVNLHDLILIFIYDKIPQTRSIPLFSYLIH